MTNFARLTFFFAILALVIAARPASAQVLRDEATGVTFPVPKGWFVAQAADMLDPRDVEFGTEQFQSAVRNYRGPKPQAVLKYKEPYPDLNPSVQFQTFPKPAPDISETDFLSAAIVALRMNLNQAAIIKPVSVVKLSVRKAAHCVFDYVLTYAGQTIPVRAEIWIAEASGRMVLLKTAAKRDDAKALKELRSVASRIAFTSAR